jgi:hypothetical protein
MRIWKYPLQTVDIQTLQIPYLARLLCVQMQHGTPCLWVLVDEGVTTIPWHFTTYGTGNPMPDSDPGQYVGTYQLLEGDLVFHVFHKMT